jgi:hypothetical protein
MARQQYEVTVHVVRENVIKVWAEDEDEAEDKALDIVTRWDGVIDATAESVEEM